VSRRADYLRHGVQEIDGARIEPGEDERLEVDIRRLAHAEERRTLGSRLEAALDGEHGALGALAETDRVLRQLERLDPDTAGWRVLLDQGWTALEELSRAVRGYGTGVDEDPDRLDRLERRRHLLDRLRQKHGATLAQVRETRDAAAAELDLLDTADLDLRVLAAEREAADRALDAAAAALTARRRAAGDKLARAVNRMLPRLGLPGGRLDAQLVPLSSVGPHGAESVQLVVQLNAGLEPRPVQKAASGGELSRLMLALTVALARRDGVPTLVFDEIDQGVSGEVGGRIGAALAEVATRHQVLVITHQAGIAALADRHLVVAKRTRGGLATTDVGVIHGEDRVIELARMLGDAESLAARRHAMELLGERSAR
jgi:DNA repair protein RecN (Recombination protein N)